MIDYTKIVLNLRTVQKWNVRFKILVLCCWHVRFKPCYFHLQQWDVFSPASVGVFVCQLDYSSRKTDILLKNDCNLLWSMSQWRWRHFGEKGFVAKVSIQMMQLIETHTKHRFIHLHIYQGEVAKQPDTFSFQRSIVSTLSRNAINKNHEQLLRHPMGHLSVSKCHRVC